MLTSKFSCGTTSSELVKKELYKDPIFLNGIYDSAAWGVNSDTGSVLYSLTRLIQIEMEIMGNEGLLDYLQDEQDLFQLLSDNFCNLFEDLQKRRDGIPPTLLFDVIEECKLVA